MPDFIVASTTATQEEIDHAVSADWRTPIPVKEETKKETAKPDAEVEQVAPETPQETEEVETASVPEAEQEQETEEQRPKGKGGFQKKIDKLTREKGELAAKLAEYEDRFAQIEKRLAPAAETKDEKPTAKTDSATPPKPLESEIGTKYKDWTEYNEALIDWKADRRLEAKLAERDKTAEEREVQAIQESRTEGYKEAAKEFIEKEAPDFNEAITAATKAGMKLPEPIIELIQDLPNGPAVTYYLVTHPDDALALIDMSPAMGFAAIGRISQGLEKTVAPPKPPAKKAVSTAPPAVRPVAGNSAKMSASLQDISKSSTDEYIRVRQAQIREREQARYR
jgi:hypothetical protein